MKEIEVIKIRDEKKYIEKDTLAEEISLNVEINSQRIAEIPCSGKYLNELLTGYLFTNHFIHSISDIISLDYDLKKQKATIRLKESEVNPPGSIPLAVPKMRHSTVFELMEKFTGESSLFQETGGVHSAGLISDEKMLTRFDDISRHNAIDMVIGYSLLNNILLQDKAFILTCRTTRSIVEKIKTAGGRFIITKSAPTLLAVHLCREYGITLAGFVRGQRMNIYSGKENLQR